MDFNKVATITIGFDDFQDLLAQRTGNPITEEEVPEMLRTAIKSGAKVILTELDGSSSLELKLNSNGSFIYESVA